MLVCIRPKLFLVFVFVFFINIKDSNVTCLLKTESLSEKQIQFHLNLFRPGPVSIRHAFISCLRDAGMASEMSTAI